MAYMRQDPKRRLVDLESEIASLTERLDASERARIASEHSLVELGLRLSQENEALRKELAALREKIAGDQSS